jgi:hypothetical protein
MFLDCDLEDAWSLDHYMAKLVTKALGFSFRRDRDRPAQPRGGDSLLLPRLAILSREEHPQTPESTHLRYRKGVWCRGTSFILRGVWCWVKARSIDNQRRPRPPPRFIMRVTLTMEERH